VHTPSLHRVEPRCEYFGDCGGCQLQHIDYDHQLALKREVVVEQLRRIGHLTDVEVRPMLASPDPWYYRNHARFTVDREGYLGFTLRGRKRIVRTMTCYIIHPWIRDTMRALQGECQGMRQVAMRIGINTGDTLIQPPLPVGIVQQERGPAVSGTRRSPGLRALDPAPDAELEPARTHDGPISLPMIESGQKAYDEVLLGQRFHVSAASFFQVNTAQAENLIRLVRDGLALDERDVLLDAYAGVGTFAKTLADGVKRVIAIEVSSSSVADGQRNTLGKENVEWVEGEVEVVLPRLRQRPTAVVLDPSRQGCGMTALETLINERVPRIAYVSCEPATLARDLRILVDGGYVIDHVQPVDMFPQTYHIECVAILGREEGRGKREERG
jgi:23S rRNA (uracil1939-C5)-methyltransferase